MLKKIVPFPVRGVIWYQGETDGDYHAEAYETVFRVLIENWRDLWQEELPFLFVQLAPFQAWMELTGRKYGIVRHCQEKISRNVPNVWMATSGDVGMRWDIHPKNKKPIGERLALLARGHVYGEDILCDAPAAVSATKKGQGIEVLFQNADGLMVEGDALQAMQAVMEDDTVQSVTCAEIASDKLILPGLGKVKELRFAMEDYCEVNLYNRAHIPARPFTLNVVR